MKKTILNILAFCAGIAGLIIGATLEGGNYFSGFGSTLGFVFIGLSIWCLKISLVGIFTDISHFFRSK